MSRKQRKLKELTDKWYDLLKKDGFVDIEDSRQRLKNKDHRTIGFQNQEIIRNFFLALDSYLITAELEPLHRNILQLYTQGIFLKEIARRVGRSEPRIRQIIKHYKEVIIAFPQE